MTKQRSKILFIHHAAGWGGAPISMIKLINNLDRSKYEVKVLLLKSSILVDKLKEYDINFCIASSPFYTRYYKYFSHSEAGFIKWYQIIRFVYLSFIWLLSRYYFAKIELERHDFDLVHLNSSVLTDWLSPSKRRGKVIIQIREPFRHGNVDILRPFFISQIKKYSDHIIAISNDNASRVAIPEKTTVIYNFSEVPKYYPSEYSYSSKIVLYMGGSANIKGFKTLVEALDYLNENVRVFFCGDYEFGEFSQSTLKSKLKKLFFARKKKIKLIEKMRNHPNAIELGMIEDVHQIYNEICCLISPHSLPHFSRPIIEAHLHKKPVIGTDVKGMDEIIDHKKNGLLIPKNNALELAASINYMTSDGNLSKIMGETGYKTAMLKFTPCNISLVENLYDNLLS